MHPLRYRAGTTVQILTRDADADLEGGRDEGALINTFIPTFAAWGNTATYATWGNMAV
jgi:hypothetical protein